jgi:transcriptional regulator with XRE-family HTH domain
MKDRILKFLTAEKISPAEFADKIGVQRSSMSHILNGRNYPSASFLQKMLQAYPAVNSRWLMIGDGSMYIELLSGRDTATNAITLPDSREESESPGIPESGKGIERGIKIDPVSGSQADNFSSVTDSVQRSSDLSANQVSQKEIKFSSDSEPFTKSEPGSRLSPPFPNINVEEREIEQILFFYKDKTFTIYKPS